MRVYHEVLHEVPCEVPNHNLTYHFWNGRYSPNHVFSCVNLESPQKMGLETLQSELFVILFSPFILNFSLMD